MLKKRLIFTLLYGDGVYNLSRNFRLQRVGDLSWVQENYEFTSIARSIDELVVLEVSRGDRDLEIFAAQLELLSESCFMPLAAGGGIRTLDHAYRLFEAGADKVVVNSALFTDPALVETLAASFGAQSIMASLDYRLKEDGTRMVFTDNGATPTGMTLEQALAHIAKLNVGEVYLTSIDRDGTGNGFDLDALRMSTEISAIPTIASGGAGNYVHLIDGLQVGRVGAVSTANLFNFMGAGIEEARELMADEGIPLSMWREWQID